MSTNFTGDALSDQQIFDYANRLRNFFEIGELSVPDVIELLNRDRIFTRFGEKHFEYKVVPDTEIAGDEALTLVSNSHVRIRISENTYQRAKALDRRSRFTLAHELGHVVLHKNKAELARSRFETSKRVVAAYVSVERQADVFASAFLITEAMTNRAHSADELADIALVTSSAADVRWERAQKQANKPLIQAGFRTLHAELLNKEKSAKHTDRFVCPVCAQHTLLKIGVKYLCVGPCDQVYDAFPDGDAPFK
jgi:hypothetical protein